jgi:hypothetical protein
MPLSRARERESVLLEKISKCEIRTPEPFAWAWRLSTTKQFCLSFLSDKPEPAPMILMIFARFSQQFTDFFFVNLFLAKGVCGFLAKGVCGSDSE